MNSCSFWPILKIPIGPDQGILETERAREAAKQPIISGSFSPSQERQVTTTWISLLMCPGNLGLIVLSMNLEVKIASSEGRLSLLIYLEPRIFPAA